MPLLNILNSLLLVRAWRALQNADSDDFSRSASGERLKSPLRSAVGICSLAGVLLLNLAQQGWALVDRELITFPLRNQVEIVRSAARFLQDEAPLGSQLLTFDTQLAVESGLAVPPGFEMSFFGYRPTWPTGQARRYRVINNELLLEAMGGNVGAVALTDYDLDLLYGDRDLLLKAILDNYRWAKTVTGFGPFHDDSLRIFLPPRYDPPDAGFRETARLADGIALLGYDLEQRAHQRGKPLELALYWQAQTPQRGSYTVFTHLLDSAGAVAAGQDNPPCHSTCGTESWHEGEVVRDEYLLPLGRDLKPGEYTLEIGMYNPATGARLAILSDSGEKIDDRIVLGTVVVE